MKKMAAKNKNILVRNERNNALANSDEIKKAA